jgi:hypothetical protein
MPPPKSSVLTSGSTVANLNSGPDYAVFATEYSFFILHIPQDVFTYPGLKATGLGQWFLTVTF